MDEETDWLLQYIHNHALLMALHMEKATKEHLLPREYQEETMESYQAIMKYSEELRVHLETPEQTAERQLDQDPWIKLN